MSHPLGGPCDAPQVPEGGGQPEDLVLWLQKKKEEKDVDCCELPLLVNTFLREALFGR